MEIIIIEFAVRQLQRRRGRTGKLYIGNSPCGLFHKSVHYSDVDICIYPSFIVKCIILQYILDFMHRVIKYLGQNCTDYRQHGLKSLSKYTEHRRFKKTRLCVKSANPIPGKV